MTTILKKILKSFLNPKTLPHKIKFHTKKIYNKVIYESNYKKEEFLQLQKKKFKNYNIDYEAAIKKLRSIRESCSELTYSNNLPHSEHSTFFVGLSLIKNLNITNILEIGTYNAQNAFLLSLLFDNAKVLTVDLPRTSLNYVSSYERDDDEKRKLFLEDRDERISKRHNLDILEENSINLIKKKINFDLVWVDGAHSDPIVSIDIYNAIKSLKKDGLILCDDVKQTNNNATWSIINLLKQQKIIDFDLIYKSLDATYNANPQKRSYIAILKKTYDD